MHTEYYCDNCEETITEQGRLPNINARHDCGTVLRIVAHEHMESSGKNERH